MSVSLMRAKGTFFGSLGFDLRDPVISRTCVIKNITEEWDLFVCWR